MLWGRRIGAVSWDQTRTVGIFQYDPEFLGAGIEVAPFMMPAREAPFEFPALSRETFKGLPGMLADSLPDRFGNRLIDAWLEESGRPPESFNPVDRLCYIGRRGMGALEFQPAFRQPETKKSLDVGRLADTANRVLDERARLAGHLGGESEADDLEDLLSVGTSAGGARAKAVLAWNPETREFRSGQLEAGAGFEHWLLKFDGISNDSSNGLTDSKGCGQIEFAYAAMARAAGITMSDCRLHHEGGRSHFMTKRFDRGPGGQKIHVQSFGALRHFDFTDPSANSYEQVTMTIRELGLGMTAVEEQVRRTFFNVIARNQDDHVKNISFLMDKAGKWTLSPAYDLTFAYNPCGTWTRGHQMSLAGRRSGFERDDVLQFAASSGLKGRRAMNILNEVGASVQNWRRHACEAGISSEAAAKIEKTFRLGLVSGR